MQKFFIYISRGVKSIIEVECEKVFSSEACLKEGEYKAKILAPSILLDKEVPTIFYSHCLYDSLEEAKRELEKQTREMFERDLRKHGITYTEESVQDVLSAVPVLMLIKV